MKARIPGIKIITHVLVLLLLLLGGPADADVLKHPLQIQTELSSGGFLKDNCSLPVTVEITNSGEEFQGKLSLNLYRYHTGEPDSYYQEIQVPARGRKQFFLYIPAVENVSSKITVKVSRGRDFIEKPVMTRRANPGDINFIILNRQRGGMAYLSGFSDIFTGPNAIINLAYPDPSILPIHWKCYDSADYLLINDYPSLNLDRAREKAIIEHVIAGGHLIISTNLDPSEFNGTLLKEYLPMLPVRTIDMDSPDETVFARQNPLLMEGRIKGEVLLRAGAVPLLLRSSLGMGKIYFITADLSKKPFREDYEKNILWRNIITIDSRNTQGVAKASAPLSNALTQAPEVAPVRMDIIFWIILSYIVLVGPVNYFYLKKKDLLLKLFVTVPIIALSFSLLMYFIGYSARGSRIIQRTLNLVYVDSTSRGTFIDSTMSLFSPFHFNYNITLKSPEATAWETATNFNTPVTQVRQQENFILENQRIPMWSNRWYNLQRSFLQEGTIDRNITLSGNQFTGYIINNTGKSLEDCVIIIGDRISQKFHLPPGELKVDIPADTSTMKYPNINETLRQSLISQNKLQSHQLNSLPRNERSMAVIRLSMINSFFQNRPLQQDANLLIGWNSDPVNPVELNHRGVNSTNLNLFIVR